MKKQSGFIPQRGLNLDYVMWLFTRFSGLVLLLFGVSALTAALIMGARYQVSFPALLRWAFFPNPNHVISSSIPDISQGWVGGMWRVLQLMIVIFGVTHGINGIRMVLEDFLDYSLWRPIMRWVLLTVWMLVVIAACMLVLVF